MFQMGLKGISSNSNVHFLWGGNSDVQPVPTNKLSEVQHSRLLFFFSPVFTWVYYTVL